MKTADGKKMKSGKMYYRIVVNDIGEYEILKFILKIDSIVSTSTTYANINTALDIISQCNNL